MIGVGGRGGSSYQKIRLRRIFSLGVAAHERLAVAIRAFDFAALKATEVREPRAGRQRTEACAPVGTKCPVDGDGAAIRRRREEAWGCTLACEWHESEPAIEGTCSPQ